MLADFFTQDILAILFDAAGEVFFDFAAAVGMNKKKHRLFLPFVLLREDIVRETIEKRDHQKDGLRVQSLPKNVELFHGA